jgi:hypothetical protein
MVPKCVFSKGENLKTKEEKVRKIQFWKTVIGGKNGCSYYDTGGKMGRFCIKVKKCRSERHNTKIES